MDKNKSHHRILLLKIGCWTCAALMLAACAKDGGQSVDIGNHAMKVATDPNPPQVGYDAELTVRFQKSDDSLNGCHLAFRQYMPEHEMTADNVWHEMENLGKGLYRGRGSEFTMGGEWELEFKLNCGGNEQRVAVPYTLEWPE